MAWMNPVSFTAPGLPQTQTPQVPARRSDLMAYLLENNRPPAPDYSSVQSPLEGFAKAATSGLQGWMAKSALRGEEQKKSDRAGMIADLLVGQGADGAPDPRRDQIVKYLMAGGDASMFGDAIASNLGFGSPKDPIKLGAGDTLVDPNTYKPIYSAPKPAELVKPYSNAGEIKADLDAGFLTPEEAQQALAGLQKAGTSLRVNPDTGEVEFTQGGPMKPMTEAQSKDTVFVTRAAGALPRIDQFGNALTSLPEAVGGSVPIVGNYAKSPEYRQAEQAGKEFLQAILRKDTGAAITKEETEEYGTVYLPQPGDDPATLEAKRQSRARAVAAIEMGLPPSAILALEQANIQRPAMPPQSDFSDETAPVTSGPPEGVTPEEWNLMTPAERALWQ